jgi:hypothetical protein
MQPTSNNGRDSCFYMAGIDEKEEFEQSQFTTNQSRNADPLHTG